MTGVMVGGLGVGAGSDMTGLMIGLGGVGAGGTIRGAALGGLGIGAPSIRGIALAGLAAGASDVAGVVLAPGYVRITENGRMRGVSVSAFNRIQGEQRGLTIGLLNVARHLKGVQIGLLNVAKNNPPGLRVLPVLNAHFD